MPATPFHMGWFLNGTSVPRWNREWSGNIGAAWRKPDLFLDLARAMERACFDYVLIEDNTFVGDRYRNSMEVYLKYALQAPRQDPTIVATLMTQVTSRLGIVPTVGTFAYHPYLLARQIGSLDQISDGRIGCNIVTGTSDSAARNYGLPAMDEHDRRYEVAEDFLSAAEALWDSWDADAVPADPESGVFADYTKVRAPDYRGEFFATMGPLNSGPLPQGRPVIAQAGGSPRGREFASKHADTIIAIADSAQKAKEFRDDVRARLEGHGRKPDECKVLFVVYPLIGASMSEAQEKFQAKVRDASERLDERLAMMSKSTDIDFSLVDPDVPLGEQDLSTNGTQLFRSFLARNAHLTLRQAVVEQAAATNGPAFIGTPDSVAGQMAEFVEEVGGDGFLIGTDGVTRRVIAEICDGLMPVLQRRGLTRAGYAHTQLRDHLLEF
jgi:FMN-dependent oxidoreductase (nitrilotriacetate monooxygenase family)